MDLAIQLIGGNNMGKSAMLRGLKQGTYTVIDGHEYEINSEYNDEGGINVTLFTEDPNAIDDSFEFDDFREGFIKHIYDPNIIKDVYEYKIEYIYKGHSFVGRIASDIDTVTLWLKEGASAEDKEFAIADGFQIDFDRFYYKIVKFNEVEMKQIGPKRITDYKSRFK